MVYFDPDLFSKESQPSCPRPLIDQVGRVLHRWNCFRVGFLPPMGKFQTWHTLVLCMSMFNWHIRGVWIMIWYYYEYAWFCRSKSRDLKLANGTLDEAILDIGPVWTFIKCWDFKNISQMYICTMKQLLIALNCRGLGRLQILTNASKLPYESDEDCLEK